MSTNLAIPIVHQIQADNQLSKLADQLQAQATAKGRDALLDHCCSSSSPSSVPLLQTLLTSFRALRTLAAVGSLSPPSDPSHASAPQFRPAVQQAQRDIILAGGLAQATRLMDTCLDVFETNRLDDKLLQPQPSPFAVSNCYLALWNTLWLCLRVSTQIVANLAVKNPETQAVCWDAMFPMRLARLLSAAVPPSAITAASHTAHDQPSALAHATVIAGRCGVCDGVAERETLTLQRLVPALAAHRSAVSGAAFMLMHTCLSQRRPSRAWHDFAAVKASLLSTKVDYATTTTPPNAAPSADSSSESRFQASCALVVLRCWIGTLAADAFQTGASPASDSVPEWAYFLFDLLVQRPLAFGEVLDLLRIDFASHSVSVPVAFSLASSFQADVALQATLLRLLEAKLSHVSAANGSLALQSDAAGDAADNEASSCVSDQVPSSSSYTVHLSTFNYLAHELQTVAHQILTRKTDETLALLIENNREFSSDVTFALLAMQILGAFFTHISPSAKEPYSNLLAFVAGLGKLAEGVQTLAPANAVLDASPAFAPFVSLKGAAVQLLGNMCFRCRAIQSALQDSGALVFLLNQCIIDEQNPYLREWAVLSIRNACENNPENQDFIRRLQSQGIANPAELDALGLDAADDRGYIKVRPKRP